MNKSACIKEVNGIRVAVAYICVSNGNMTDSYAPRFASTYQEFPAEYPHGLIVICNGGPLVKARKDYFSQLDCEFYHRPNDGGFDISAYQDLAGAVDADFLVCFGESVYFHRPGWLARLMEAREQFGEGMYGMFATHAVRAHMNTTAFGCDPRFLKQYPPVQNHPQRYEFEHGPTALWRRLVAGGHQAVFVTWDGDWLPGEWRMPPNILNRGSQRNLLVLCNHTDRFDSANATTRNDWIRTADIPYK